MRGDRAIGRETEGERGYGQDMSVRNKEEVEKEGKLYYSFIPQRKDEAAVRI